MKNETLVIVQHDIVFNYVHFAEKLIRVEIHIEEDLFSCNIEAKLFCK